MAAAALRSADLGTRRERITSIWSHHDNIVAPQTPAALPGARNIEVGGIGHVRNGERMRWFCSTLPGCRIFDVLQRARYVFSKQVNVKSLVTFCEICMRALSQGSFSDTQGWRFAPPP
jgi:hypothetical protein